MTNAVPQLPPLSPSRREAEDELLRSSVRLARLIFSAAAASIFVYATDRDALVFEASSGQGADLLIGMSVPPDRGIVGWVWQSGETVIAHDVSQDIRFDREFAEFTGYLPTSMVAAPIASPTGILGVIEVLDPDLGRHGEVEAMEVMSELAAHLAAALAVRAALHRDDLPNDQADLWWRLRAALSPTGDDSAAVERFVIAFEALTANGKHRSSARH